MTQAPRRVLHVINYGWPYIDGYTVRSMGLVTAQRRYLGLDVTVVTSPFPPLARARDPDFATEDWGPGVQIEARTYSEWPRWGHLRSLERPSLGLAPVTSEVFRRELTSIVDRLGPDLIHVHHPHYIGSVALEVARSRSLPFVYEVRCFNGDYDYDARNPYYWLRGWRHNHLEHWICRQANAVVTISEGLARRIIAAGTPADRVSVVRNSVDTDHFVPDTGDRCLPSGVLTIGYATTFEMIEGLDNLVRAARMARDALQSRGRRLRVVLAGTGREWPRIRGLVDELGLDDIVELPGFIPYGRMPGYYRNLNLFVVPRRRVAVSADTTPLKPLEALAMGLPLLVSELPAMRELLGGRAAVRFVKPTPERLSRAIIQFADRPWKSDGTPVGDRSWRQEVRKYGPIYAAAARSASCARTRPVPIGRAAWAARSSRKRLLRAAADRGWFGLTQLQKHIIICGSPRSGTTLLQLIIDCCVADVDTFPVEVHALFAADHAERRRPFLVTKMPDDIVRVPEIRARYRSLVGEPHFVAMFRDPRAVLTSIHKAYPASRGYYVSIERWRDVRDRIEHIKGDPDVTLVRYEDLVRDPDRVQETLAERIGWTVRHPFSHYYEIAAARGLERDSMTEGALGGMRPLDTASVDAWRRPEHAGRLQRILEEIPQLPDDLITMGYESDRSWLAMLSVEQEATP